MCRCQHKHPCCLQLLWWKGGVLLPYWQNKHNQVINWLFSEQFINKFSILFSRTGKMCKAICSMHFVRACSPSLIKYLSKRSETGFLKSICLSLKEGERLGKNKQVEELISGKEGILKRKRASANSTALFSSICFWFKSEMLEMIVAGIISLRVSRGSARSGSVQGTLWYSWSKY